MKTILLLGAVMMLTGCATGTELSSGADDTAKTQPPITRIEAQREACPKALLEAGASPADCSCISDKLYELGQEPGALSYGVKALEPVESPENNQEDGRRKIAIGLLRHDAIEQCGLFDPDHIVAKNL